MLSLIHICKRLSKDCKLNIIEVADEKAPDQASAAVEESIREKEGERLLKHIKEDAFVMTLEIQGKQITSEELACLLYTSRCV